MALGSFILSLVGTMLTSVYLIHRFAGVIVVDKDIPLLFLLISFVISVAALVLGILYRIKQRGGGTAMLLRFSFAGIIVAGGNLVIFFIAAIQLVSLIMNAIAAA